MLILEKEIREALARTGLALRSDNPNFYGGVFDDAKVEVFLHSGGTFTVEPLIWGEKAVAPFVSNIPRLARTITGS